MKSSQIELLPLSLSHCEELVRYAQDPTLWTWWLRRPPTHLFQMQQEIQTALDQQRQGLRIAYAIKQRTKPLKLAALGWVHLFKIWESIENANSCSSTMRSMN
jgi:hypothetical protein